MLMIMIITIIIRDKISSISFSSQVTKCGARGLFTTEVSTTFTLLKGESELAVDAVSLQQRKNNVT